MVLPWFWEIETAAAVGQNPGKTVLQSYLLWRPWACLCSTIIWVQNIKIWRHNWLHLCLNQFLTGVKGVEEINDEPMTEKEEENFHQLEVLSAKNEICTRFITWLPPILNSESKNIFHEYFVFVFLQVSSRSFHLKSK